MISSEDVRWKLAVCEVCQKRRMMPDADGACLSCGREHRAATLSPEDIRWVISFREPASFVRAAWMLATPSTNAATGLDVRTGAVTPHRWPAGDDMPMEETDDVIILAVCPAARKAELPGLLAAEGSLSVEDAEGLAVEAVVKSALGDGGERFWTGVDEQLRAREPAHGRRRREVR